MERRALTGQALLVTPKGRSRTLGRFLGPDQRADAGRVADSGPLVASVLPLRWQRAPETHAEDRLEFFFGWDFFTGAGGCDGQLERRRALIIDFDGAFCRGKETWKLIEGHLRAPEIATN